MAWNLMIWVALVWPFTFYSDQLLNIWLTFFGFCEERHALRMFFQGMNLKNVWIFRLVTAFRTGVEQIVVTIIIQTWVVYMCSSLLQLAPGSRDLFQAEKRITEYHLKLSKFRKITQNCQSCQFWEKIVVVFFYLDSFT